MSQQDEVIEVSENEQLIPSDEADYMQDNDSDIEMDNSCKLDYEDGEDENGDGDDASWLLNYTLHDGAPIYCIDVNPMDPCLVATGGGNDVGVLSRIDPETNQLSVVASLGGHTDTVDHVKFSPKGRYLATGGLDCNVIIWNSKDGSQLHCLSGPDEVGWIAWNPDESMIAAGSLTDGTVWVWKVDDGSCLGVFSGNSKKSLAGQFTPNGRYLVTTDVGCVFVWDIETCKASVTYKGFKEQGGSDEEVEMISLAIDAKSNIAMVGGSDGSVRILNLLHQKTEGEVKGHGDAVEWVSFCPSLRFLITASLDGSLMITDPDKLTLRSKSLVVEDGSFEVEEEENDEGESANPGGITSAVLIGTKKGETSYRLLTGSINGCVSLWEIRDGTRIGMAYNLNAPCLGVAYIDSLHMALGVFEDGRLLGFAI